MGDYYNIYTTSQDSTDQGGGVVAWTDVERIAVGDGIPGSATLGAFETTSYADSSKLAVTSGLGNSSFIAHPRAIVTGVLVEVVAQCDTDSSAQLTQVFLSDTTAQQGNALSASKPIETSYKDVSIGGDGEMWGLTSAQIKSLVASKFFGVTILAEEIAGNRVFVEVDGVRVTIYYNLPRILAAVGAGL